MRNIQKNRGKGKNSMNTDENREVLKAVMTTAFITTYMGSALNLSVPALEVYFDANSNLIGWIVTIYTLTVAAFSVPIGKVADVTGKKKVFVSGIAVFALLSAACIFAPDIRVMIILRCIQGIAAAMIFATNNAILISCFPSEKRGKVLGLSTAATYVGLSAGPVIGGMLNHYFSWQAVFVSSVAVSLAALCFAVRVPDDAKSPEEKDMLDVKGNISYVIAIASSLYGLSSLTASSYGWIFLAGGIVFGVIFVRTELKAARPLIKISMFTQDTDFTLSNISALLNYGATYAISYLISIYLQIVMGFSSGKAGLVLIAMPLTQAVFSPAMGKLSDKREPYKIATAGMGLCVLSLILFSFINENTPLAYLMTCLVITGFGFALFSSPNTNAIMQRVKKEDYSVANSIVATMRTYGQSASMCIVSMVMGLTLAGGSLEAASVRSLVTTLRYSFYVYIVMCSMAVFFSCRRGKESSKHR